MVDVDAVAVNSRDLFWVLNSAAKHRAYTLLTMVRGKAMWKEVKPQVRVFAIRGATHCEISSEVGFSESTVGAYLRCVKASRRGGKPETPTQIVVAHEEGHLP